MDDPQNRGQIIAARRWATGRYRLPQGYEFAAYQHRLRAAVPEPDRWRVLLGEPPRDADNFRHPITHGRRASDADHHRRVSEPEDRVVGELHELRVADVERRLFADLGQQRIELGAGQPAITRVADRSSHARRSVAILSPRSRTSLFRACRLASRARGSSRS